LALFRGIEGDNMPVALLAFTDVYDTDEEIARRSAGLAGLPILRRELNSVSRVIHF
jgi:hypothetical protein